MKWYMWIGKFLLLAVAVVEAIIKAFGVNIPWVAIISPAATWGADMLLGLIPGEGWGKIVGKILVWMVNVGELIVAQLGLQIPIWSVIAPMLMGLAQYFIGLAAKAEPSPS